MGAMFRQMFAAFAALFMAFERIANSLNNLAEVAEETSAQYKDDARITRAELRAKREAEHRKLLKQLEADANTPAAPEQ